MLSLFVCIITSYQVIRIQALKHSTIMKQFKNIFLVTEFNQYLKIILNEDIDI